MAQKDKKTSKESKRFSISIVMYVAAVIVAILGITALVNNIILFKGTVAQYVAQGYEASTVNKLLIPSQLLPGIFEPIAVYWGIALVLVGAGIINKKVSKCLVLLGKEEVCNNSAEENIIEKNAHEENNTEIKETPQDAGTVDKTAETQS
ncbi:hypothetical protein [Clostridium sp. JN-9]|uniref:hypothetical protein n=1 Tax=Clostridium sp. JN-9 TaxID=2507159 RepID=UPI001FAA2A04|nr:hypothetical protein [Clostridium sp. JN-9]